MWRMMVIGTGCCLFAALVCRTSAADPTEGWVRGTVTDIEIHDKGGEITVELFGSGEARTFVVSPDTEFDSEPEWESVAPSAPFPDDSLNDLRVGDEVMINARQGSNSLWSLIKYEIAVTKTPIDSQSQNDDETEE